jgi:hypothetical protein
VCPSLGHSLFSCVVGVMSVALVALALPWWGSARIPGSNGSDAPAALTSTVPASREPPYASQGR